MKAAKTVLMLVLSAAVGGAYADDGGSGGGRPKPNIVKQTPAAPAPAKQAAPPRVAKPGHR
jgi:hypothetical protein